ncbi:MULTISPECIES: SAM-dependent methyltransferase [Thermoactinomyces]|uniref:S-adenosyl-L-methionine-dependent methyltransferase n=1 Tax=Thermoactinomyces daqus TaxID=1329516 RepID=A0A7W1X7I5_9BACL|nr:MULTISPECIES: SAM-dependent methyltransferase [Thermoactinomyces]MBA4541493.1 SAM-dependent methyltransferase [Thermoactinomyces daqus]MBH8596969.1 SAM-dependent methyltransferase [Thermoactinomyces sp. CICC 10523]MBH8603745.1 SAM-dependent methyltransferase [Thermoactinomyces sp. CICC 10522]MBH8607620.1 SAM-dependent methyltransferase [Thermoactinomyces sp. CICC 10521]
MSHKRRKSARASKTAEFVAFFRALEYSFPKERRLFEDPFAVRFLSLPLQVASCLSRVPLFGKVVPFLVDCFGPGARASGVARTRLIDDHLTNALEKGIEQVVILGSGYDSRAYRIADIERVHVFEVDQPQTLSVKQKKLKRVLKRRTRKVTFVETDLNVQKLEDTLLKAGFDLTRPAFFIWEGVTNYLIEQAVDLTLRFISTAAPGSFILFTYVHKQAIDTLASSPETRRIYRLLTWIDEPWTFGMVPEELPAYLESHGLKLVEDVNSVEFRKRYMNPGGPHMNAYRFYRAALAEVKNKGDEPQVRFFRSFFH